MTDFIELGAGPIGLAELVAVARGNPRIRLSDSARAAMRVSEDWVADISAQMDRGEETQAIYSINTGFGSLSGRQAFTSSAQARDLSRRLDDASREIAALEEKVAGLDDRVVRGGDETDRLELSLDALETRLDTVTAERDSLRRQLAETSQRLAELQAVTTDVEPAAGNANANAGNAANRNAENPQAANLRRPQAGATQPAASLPPLTIVRPAPDATVNDGISAYEAGDYARARDIWRELAEAGSPRAQFHLGSLLYEGRVGQPDLVQAYRWLSRSVERGFGPALSMRDRVRSSMSREQLGEAEGPLG